MRSRLLIAYRGRLTWPHYSDGRLKSVTGPSVPDPGGNGGTLNFTTQYAYNLSTNTTTITNPDGGTVTRQDDSFGNPLSVTEQVTSGTNRTTTYQYDSKENLIKVVRPCGNATCSDSSGNDTWVYTYDANGFQTSVQARVCLLIPRPTTSLVKALRGRMPV